MTPKTYTDDPRLLLEILPARLRDVLAGPSLEDLVAIVMGLRRPPQARFPGRALDLCEEAVTREELDRTVEKIGQFDADNGAGIGAPCTGSRRCAAAPGRSSA